MPPPQVTQAFLRQRDAAAFRMRQAGMSDTQVAQELGITTRQVNTATKRELSRISRENLLLAPEQVQLHVGRLDALLLSVWPLTQRRKLKVPREDDPDVMEEITVEPDLKAVDTALKILGQQAKLQGLERLAVDVTLDVGEASRAVLAGFGGPGGEAERQDPLDDTRRLLEILQDAGAIDVGKLVRELASPIMDAEVVEDVEESP